MAPIVPTVHCSDAVAPPSHVLGAFFRQDPIKMYFFSVHLYKTLSMLLLWIRDVKLNSIMRVRYGLTHVHHAHIAT